MKVEKLDRNDELVENLQVMELYIDSMLDSLA